MWLPEEGLKDFIAAPPATAADVLAAEEALGLSLPADYKAFLRLHDGASGWIVNTRLQLWRAGELAALNQPGAGVLAFGDDGREAALAFDMRGTPWPVVILPLATLDPEAARPVSPSFAGLFYRLARSERSPFAG